MNKLYKFNLYMLYLFTIGFIMMVSLDKYNFTLYSGVFVGIIYVIIYYINVLKNKKNTKYYDRIDKVICKLCYIYFFIAIINIILVDYSNIVYTIFRILPVFVFILLINDTYLRNNTDKIINLVQKIFIVCSIMALVLYLFGYSKLNFSFKNFLNLITVNEYKYLYGEPRLSWMCTHKSRFALFCIIGMGFVLTDEKMKNINKIFFSLIFLIDIYLSSSITVLIISLIIIFFYILYELKNINKYLFIPFTIITIVLFSGLGFKYYYKTSEVRDISTIGSRKYIWNYSIMEIKEHPYGLTYLADNYSIEINDNDKSFTVNNGHNVFINEMLERGVACGVIYFLIFVCILIKFKKYNKKLYVIILLGIIVSSTMDYTISSEMLYIFWYTCALSYCKCNDA